MKQMTLIEMDGFLKGKCIPRDLKVNETNAEYLVRKFGELESKLNEQREYYEGVISDGSKRIAELEKSEEQLINERDHAEYALADMYFAATGNRPEWSNCFSFSDAVDAVVDRIADLEAKQPSPVVPEEKPMPNPLSMYAVDAVAAIAEVRGWNACRAAMLHGAKPVSQTYKLNKLSGNSPVTPDGWVMVPKEPTQAMIKAWLSEIANFRGHAAGYRAALEAAPQLEVNRG
ncbi:ead/Ea22-like family protein [Escherichia coli]|nr:ead/Ea22-like family protein [Escherichia coli]MCJ2731437.1 ead/Ea22-like family protein [Escherichia coli]MDE4858542.1 ead/Ea22-like family protein [Escherichia coli]MDE4863227.1 ead/Ea22-like family protein [Escherichia coli]MDE4867914.1 ead/Ea22-like family protein [Escherichia coli]MDE4872966.1 ead/Ea22-like family protein [Escherichia coli]